ncbi:MAG: CinA family nicotinamide mononucleotide deamidase-related protein [Bacteroidales bacterium]|nr:CinA family nicotinamide mononucleotide deamidase-related protein [Bacteroidales bacterium]
MNIHIINIGDELLIGQVVNTNASTMARLLTQAGMAVTHIVTVADESRAIEDAVTTSLAAADAVILTGGLGPTKDDITKTVLCRLFNSHLVENEDALNNVRRIFAARGYELTPINRQQAWVPECCTVLRNDLGTAPAMWFETADGKVLVSLPGVPFEMEWLMRNRVLPRLADHFGTDCILTKNIIVQGIGESFLSDLIEPWELALPKSLGVAYLPVAGMVKLRITARGSRTAANDLKSAMVDAVASLRSIAGQYIVGEDVETLPELVAQAFVSRHLTLATAESCTGGTIASVLTALPGTSAYFRGGVVAYSNDVKQCALGVDAKTLAEHGAVSEPTVRQMAEGARLRLCTDYAVATSGVAGPDGGTPEKPVGTVWTAIATPQGSITKLLHFGDRRQQNIDRTVNQVLADLVRTIAAQQI